VIDTVLHYVILYKYWAIYGLLMFGIIGLPVPDEVLLTFVGYLLYKGNLNFVPAVAAALLGSITGISISYVFGRTGALKIIKKYSRFFHVTPEKLDALHEWFTRKGKWTLIIGYYMPGIRHFIAIIAGTSKLRYCTFSLFAYSGAIIWITTFISAGFLLGEGWYHISKILQRDLLIASIAAIALLFLYYLIKWGVKARH
jgi:membrane protein DedA with SNARE-associated domain